MYMNDIKLFSKNEKELETLIQTIRIHSQDIEMEFDIEKSAMVMRRGKRQITEGRELPNHERIRTLREMEIYKYWEILEADTIKEVEMKKIKKEFGFKNFFLHIRKKILKPNTIAEISSKE